MKKIFFIAIAIVAMASCTENQRAKQFGGTVEYTIPSDKQFVNATWKDSDLWIITTDRDSNHTPKTYYMDEQSSYGVWEGTVIINEK